MALSRILMCPECDERLRFLESPAEGQELYTCPLHGLALFTPEDGRIRLATDGLRADASIPIAFPVTPQESTLHELRAQSKAVREQSRQTLDDATAQAEILGDTLQRSTDRERPVRPKGAD